MDPENNKLDDLEERERLRRVFSHGLGNPTGFVLPLQRGVGKDGPEWQTALWMLRARHLFLLPGDSPVGLRLPLQSLKAEPAEKIQRVWTIDPMSPAPPLRVTPSVPRSLLAWQGEIELNANPVNARQRQNLQPVPGEADELDSLVRTALTVEPREGRLCLFLPPVRSAEDYVDLIGAIEETAAKLQMPVILEGYTPPFDSRLQQIKITPDPGVIEVNIHPSHNWRELVHNTTTLYEQARQCRLGTEKFMLDGRHTGTGGGNHLVLGGSTPPNSPFLRRPDLIKSLVGYWLNHPALSYLFSGTFIGPTSQAPRVDEARDDNLYELAIAFQQMDKVLPTLQPGDKPWMVVEEKNETFTNGDKVVPPSVERAKYTLRRPVLRSIASKVALIEPFRPTAKSLLIMMSTPVVLRLTLRGAEKVAPPSVERLIKMLSGPADPPHRIQLIVMFPASSTPMRASSNRVFGSLVLAMGVDRTA